VTGVLAMHTLTHFPLCPFSRSIRLLLTELGEPFELVEERPWEWRQGFLALNPSGDLPVLTLAGGIVLCGAYAISEYLGEVTLEHPRYGGPPPIIPGGPEERSEVRRLIDWFHRKLEREASRDLLEEKVYARFDTRRARPADSGALRSARQNLRYHLGYIGFLADQRRWLAGDDLSFADFAAAAHVSVMDYLGEIVWGEHPGPTEWYQRIKSRPSFRPLLADRLAGLPPPPHYPLLDF
jgi:glutathione S-transferase